jgi:hypothetical protein
MCRTACPNRDPLKPQTRFGEWLEMLFRYICSDPDWPPNARLILDWRPEGAWKFDPSVEERKLRLQHLPSIMSAEVRLVRNRNSLFTIGRTG